MFLVRKIMLPVLLLFWSGTVSAQFLNANLRKGDVDEIYEEAVRQTERKNYPKAIELAKKAVERYPNNVDYNLLLGRLYVLTRDYKRARPYIIKVLDKSPKYRDAYFYAINIELGEGNPTQAIGYCNRALMRFPDDLEFNVKKLSILDADKKFTAGNALAEDIIRKYPDRQTAQNAWVAHHEEAGKYYRDKGLLTQARYHFEQALKIAPDNQDAVNYLAGLNVRTGDHRSALEQVNLALASNPTSYDLLMRKMALLQEMHQYADATAVLKTLKKHYPNDAKVRQMDVELKLDASRYYEHTDPYVLYQSVLESSPGNREALNKLIAISMDRGVYRNALEWINKGLKTSPGDATLLAKKADVLEILNNKTEAANIVNELWAKDPSNEALRTRASELKVASGKYYLTEKLYDKALQEFESALNIDPSNADAVGLIANLYIEQKDYENALRALNMALQYREDDEQLLLKKASVLADAGRYNEAFPVISTLIAQHPDNPRYGAILTEQQMQAGRLLMNSDEMEKALRQFKQALQISPQNRDALTYIVNLESGIGRPDSALRYVNLALQYYPDDKDFLLKKVSVLSEQKQYRQAYGIAAKLMQEYPYNKAYRAAYIDNLVSSGLAYQRREVWDEALAEFNKVLAISPYDSTALYAAINLYNAQKQYDSALALVDKGLRYYAGNLHLTRQRAVTLENKRMYADAAAEADKLVAAQPSQRNIDYANYLRSKMLRNQFGLYYQQSTYNTSMQPYRIATVEYRRFFKDGSFGARVNIGGRHERAGTQYEADLYFNHTKTLYSYAVGAYSNNLDVFPNVRLGYSLFKGWKHDWETELGVRYIKVQSVIDSVVTVAPQEEELYRFTQYASMVSGVASIAKGMGDFWFNLRGYLIFDNPEEVMRLTAPDGTVTERRTTGGQNTYQSFQLTSRYYMNNRQEYLYVIGSMGTSPDDRSRVILIPQLVGNWLTQAVTLGYQKTFNYRTTVSGSVGWSNNRIGINRYLNQFDLYLSLIRKF
jgi:tetratricopeptide (TPR) repeat protein